MNTHNPTTITDIQIPFGRLVLITLKLMLAAIPAVLVFYFIAGLLTYLLVVGMRQNTPTIDFLPGTGIKPSQPQHQSH